MAIALLALLDACAVRLGGAATAVAAIGKKPLQLIATPGGRRRATRGRHVAQDRDHWGSATLHTAVAGQMGSTMNSGGK